MINIPVVNVGTLRYAGPGTPNKKIQSDPNFLALVNIDNEILKGLDSNKIWLDSAEFESAVNDIENASNSDELIHGLTEFGDLPPILYLKK